MTYIQGYKDRFFLGQQAYIDTPDVWDGTCALKVLPGTEITPVFATTARGDNHLGRGVNEIVDGPNGPHAVKIEAYYNPFTGSGYAFGDQLLFGALFDTSYSTSEFTMDTAASASGCQTTDTGAVVAGNIIFVKNPSAAAVVQGAWTRIATLSTASGIDTLTFSPTLPFTPTTATVVAACANLRPKADPESSMYLTVARFHGDSEFEQVSGFLPKSLGITVERNAQLKLEWNGVGQHYIQTGRTALTTGINAGALAMVVDDIEKYAGVDATHTAFVDLQPEGVNTLETVEVTAITRPTSTLTITRAAKGTVASAHATAAVIVPWEPTETTSGSPVPCHLGNTYIGGVATKVASAKITIDENWKPVEPAGSEELVDFVGSDLRKVDVEFKLIGSSTDWVEIGAAVNSTSQDVLTWVGNVEAKSLAVYLPIVKWEPVAIPGSPTDLKAATIKARHVLASGSGNNEYTVALSGD